MRKIGFIIAFFTVFAVEAQIDSLHHRKELFAVSDSIVFHNVSTNPYFFRISLKNGKTIDSTDYKVDFSVSKVYFQQEFYQKYSQIDSLQIQYYIYPDFLTKTYRGLDPSLIITTNSKRRPISLDNQKKPLKGKPFEGLDTQGNIIRGVRIGNNQDAVLNSILDLKIEGKLSSKVSLRARINDTNIPIQENGYSQDLKDIDRVYIEMEGPKWSVRAGDVFLKDSTSFFMNFVKKVSGVAVETHTDKIHTRASGALVRGRYTEYQFQGEEANQGPYKLNGTRGEAYIFIISGSEKVFINGIPQTRGRDKDYIIDYNTAEITFTPTNPITSNMRINIEFQYSDRNYTRFVTHESAQYIGEKLQIGVSFYNESDLKNQPLQISLTEQQIGLLSQAGSDTEQLFVVNAIETEYDENKILYRRITINTTEVYEYAANTEDILYQVSFTYVGDNQGDYRVSEYLAIGKKMEYTGENNGDYKALTPLIAPSKQQVIMLNSQYKPNHKTDLSVEMAYSDNDQNLFSAIDNDSNKAPAIKASWKQVVRDTTKRGWHLESRLNFDFLHQNFKSIERLYAIEFDRDWNLDKETGNQRLFNGEIILSNTKKGKLYYGFQNLNFLNSYNGNRQSLGVDFNFKNFKIQHLSSYLTSKGNLLNTLFTRSNTAVRYAKKKWWAGSIFDFETNQQKEIQTDNLNVQSFEFLDLKSVFGIGDTTAVFVEIGAQFHSNDSLSGTALKRVNNSKTYFVNSQLIKAKKAQLKLYANYRTIDYIAGNKTEALNSRLTYNQQLFNQFVIWQTDYQNTSGNIPQHDYTYVETEVGQGFYTWIDYNENGLQELDEFEVAQYVDQANFLRIALPNITYLPTQEVKLQQSIQLNFSKWSQKKGIKKILSHWYNRFNILAQNNKLRNGSLINVNPFDFDNLSILNNQFIIRNSLVFNRGKSHYTTTYNFTNSIQKIVQSFGSQENNLELHQLIFQHRIKENWQIGLTGIHAINSTDNEAFSNRNYHINELSIAPNIRYFFNKNHWLKAEYSSNKKDNKIGGFESLDQQQVALNYQFSNKKQTSFSVEIKALKNLFSGDSFSAVGYQMLEGLQPDNNMTWNVLWSNKLNSFLYLNLNYNGRANAFSRTIHNGNIQLRANF